MAEKKQILYDIIIKHLEYLFILIILLYSFMAVGVCTAANSNNLTPSSPNIAVNETSALEFSHSMMGVKLGSAQEKIATDNFSKCKLERFTTTSDCVLALTKGKINACILPMAQARQFKKTYPQLMFCAEHYNSANAAFSMPKTPKGRALQQEFNAFLTEIKTNGTFGQLLDKWFEATDDITEYPVPAYDSLPGPKGTIIVAIDEEFEPYSFTKEGKMSGYDVELLTMFAQKYGYKLKLSTMTMEGLILTLTSGKADMIGTDLIVTKERQEKLLFTEATSVAYSVVAFISPDYDGSDKNFWENLETVFYKCFVRENRWQLMLKGLVNTLKLTFGSAVLGTLLAAFICLLRMKSGKFINALINTYISIFQGTPVLVVLLIFYYVLFANLKLGSLLVAIITFSLNIAAYLTDVFYSGIAAVGRGQWEAAIALGYTHGRAFTRFILPQAAANFLPVYRGHLITLMKGTSIVGYIALQDLTRSGDIIRSSSYEALLPLLCVAIIYLILSYIMREGLAALEHWLLGNKRKGGL